MGPRLRHPVEPIKQSNKSGLNNIEGSVTIAKQQDRPLRLSVELLHVELLERHDHDSKSTDRIHGPTQLNAPALQIHTNNAACFPEQWSSEQNTAFGGICRSTETIA